MPAYLLTNRTRPAVVTADPRDKLQTAMDRLFDVDPPRFARAMESSPFDRETIQHHAVPLAGLHGATRDPGLHFGQGLNRSLYQSYVAITGDSELRFLNPSAGGSSARSREAQLASDWGDILGNSLYRRLLMEYAQVNYHERTIMRVENAPDFRPRETTILEYFADIDDVEPETADYTEKETLGDEKVSYSVGQKGNIVTISRKVIVNDNIRAVTATVSRFGRAARRTFARHVWTHWSANSGEGSAYGVDGKEWFKSDNSHGNYATTPLTADLDGALAIGAAWDDLALQTEPGSGEKLGRPSKASLYLIVGTAKHLVARTLAVADSFGFIPNIVAQQELFGAEGERVIEVPLAEINTTHWGLVTSERESVLVGFLQGRQEPEFATANDPTAGQAFLADKWQWKIRHEYGSVLVDYRGAAKRLASS